MPTDLSSNLHYEAYGPDDGESIVFLHGGGVAGWMWREQVRALHSQYHCLVPDLPEQGKNIHIEKEAFTTEGAADRIAAFIRAQAHDHIAHAVGLSEGAQVLVSLLSRTPQVVDHAVVSSALLRPLWINKITSRRVVSLTYRWFLAPFKTSEWWIRLNMRASAGVPDEYYDDFKFSATIKSWIEDRPLPAELLPLDER